MGRRGQILDVKFVIFFRIFFGIFFVFFISFCACEYSLLIAGLSSIEPDFEALCYVIQPVKNLMCHTVGFHSSESSKTVSHKIVLKSV